jgi:hypothetical protein
MAAFSSSDKESSLYDSPSLNLTGDSRLLQL